MTMHHARIAQIEARPLRRVARTQDRVNALPGLSSSLRSMVAGALFVVRAAGRRRKMRRDLLALSADQLRDVGLSRDEALRAAERIEWRGDWT
ncbi:DUF1127 domain-containing protein [Jiella avicenniae]|uniref:DUF1127 domain-containing protein n=1 Tax=Jiella avicenniae TaxID=2907202 RepID=A0A9X1TBQ8_9HYPH|nr:DUF1127 domain-containing protein [Jiella avicenniae]MCE7028273.1 DUF1127 domain-containing protein [Jiella avicenniae]